MKKILFVIMNVIIIMFFISCSSNSNIVTKKTITKNCINFEFQNLDGRIDGNLDLNPGDEIEIKIDIENGKLSMEVEGENKEIPYEGKDVKSGKLSFKVAKKGTYAFILSGEKTKGNISFKKKDTDKLN